MPFPSWIKELPQSGKPLPILSAPAVQLTGATVYRMTHDAECQAEVIERIAKELDMPAAVAVMDLSVEAEAFGCTVTAEGDGISTVTGPIINDACDAEKTAVPDIGAGRTGIFIQAASLAKKAVKDRPVIAGMIGPYSLAGRLMEVSEALIGCLEDPDMMHLILRKATDFLIAYAKAYKSAGLDGIILAEPLSGLLSPAMEEEFSSPYVREIISSVQDGGFAVIYHNCGPNTVRMADSISSLGAAAYHFGDAVSMKDILGAMPRDCVVMGNLSPVRYFLDGTADEMRSAAESLRKECAGYCNFVLSSGCDIPASAKWDNIRAFFG